MPASRVWTPRNVALGALASYASPSALSPENGTAWSPLGGSSSNADRTFKSLATAGGVIVIASGGRTPCLTVLDSVRARVCKGGCCFHQFYQVPRLSLYGHTGVLGSGRSPFGEAHGAGQGCFPVLPLDQCDMHFRPEPGALPQDHLGSGVVAPYLPLGQLHGISLTSPSSPCCPVCCVCIGACTAGGARGSEVASTAYSIWLFSQKGCP